MIRIEQIDREQALRYMSYKGGAISDTALTELEECERKLLETIRPVCVYRVFKINGFFPLTLENGLVLEGKDLSEHLEGCGYAALFAATVGADVDMLIRRLQITDMAKSVMTDALASAAAEQAADLAEEEIRKSLPGKFFTWRYSPGYGDLPLTVQPKLLNVLNAGKTAGIVLQKENMMSPMKSVTAVIGISEDPVEKKRMGCAECRSFEGCSLRRKGLHCGFQKTT
ncbi:vitamin B12 dependent-methionine synthase activation domain-containing protein [Ruminococcus sp. HUN007]|uniref:vitamin B12 dependent-methionine synthase activation domain-containing protein n=1 Tax=Ruminococcus sp. HUN007 TaxID=1514668 RepID=UPI000679BC65|nr:vitamin B12 dependent-methionine synthase activation domain-containing protein [Ruminococcus sp. HUN007]